MAGPQFDLNLIQIFGKCLTEDGNKTPTGKKCAIKFCTTSPDGKPGRSELKDALTFVITGPGGCKPDFMWSTLVDTSEPTSTVTGYFVPIKQGQYKLAIRFNGRKLRPEPLVIEAVGADIDVAKMLSKVTVHGRAWELGKAYAHNEFVVDCSAVQPPLGQLKVHVKGPPRASAHLRIFDNENGTYRINYKPTSPGTYTMTVKIAETDIPGSPFSVRVTEFVSS